MTRKSCASTATCPVRRSGESGPSTFTRGVELHHDPGVGEPEPGEQLGELDLPRLGLGDDRRRASQPHGGPGDDGRAVRERHLDRRELEVVPAQAEGDPRVTRACRDRSGRPESWTCPAASGEAAGPDTWSFTLALPEEGVRTRASEKMAGSGASAAISSPSLGLQRLLTVPWAETLTPSPSSAEVADGEPREVEGQVGVEGALVEQRLPAAGLDQGRAQLRPSPGCGGPR